MQTTATDPRRTPFLLLSLFVIGAMQVPVEQQVLALLALGGYCALEGTVHLLAGKRRPTEARRGEGAQQPEEAQDGSYSGANVRGLASALGLQVTDLSLPYAGVETRPYSDAEVRQGSEIADFPIAWLEPWELSARIAYHRSHVRESLLAGDTLVARRHAMQVDSCLRRLRGTPADPEAEGMLHGMGIYSLDEESARG